MKAILLASVVAGVSGLLGGASAQAHDTIGRVEQYAGFNAVIDLTINHGCEGKPVKAVRVKIPDGVVEVRLANRRDWKIETKMRKLDKPIPGEGGRTLTETVDEITWKDPVSLIPGMGSFEVFEFRARMPNPPGRILFFPVIGQCENGEDKYIDVPKEEIRADMPDFAAKMNQFRRSTKGPAPFVILLKPTKPERLWEEAAK